MGPLLSGRTKGGSMWGVCHYRLGANGEHMVAYFIQENGLIVLNGKKVLNQLLYKKNK